MSAIETCRTAALGGHIEGCEDCGHRRVATQLGRRLTIQANQKADIQY